MFLFSTSDVLALPTTKRFWGCFWYRIPWGDFPSGDWRQHVRGAEFLTLALRRCCAGSRIPGCDAATLLVDAMVTRIGSDSSSFNFPQVFLDGVVPVLQSPHVLDFRPQCLWLSFSNGRDLLLRSTIFLSLWLSGAPCELHVHTPVILNSSCMRCLAAANAVRSIYGLPWILHA